MATEIFKENSFVPKVKGVSDKNQVVLKIGNQNFYGWKSLSISKSIESFANTFSLELDDRFIPLSKQFPFPTGTQVKVNIGEERVMTGRVEAFSGSFSSDSRSVTVSGRSLTGDLVDATAIEQFEPTDVSLEELAKQLVKPFEMKVFLSVVPTKIETFAIRPGETIFEILDRAARLQGFFWITTRGGNIRLTRAGRAKASSALEQNVNILSADFEVNDTERFAEYIVVGQGQGGDDVASRIAAGAKGSSKDLGISRYRPLYMVAEGSATPETALTRARWEASTRIAKALQVNVVVQGWKQQTGDIWDINQLVRFKSEFFGLDTELLISSVEQTVSAEEGKKTTISMVRKDSFAVEPEVKKENDLFQRVSDSVRKQGKTPNVLKKD
jgi:prophage tail gpP-like protein